MGFVEKCVVGFPDHHIQGSQRHHCFDCDGPLADTLTVGTGAHVLVPNN